MSKSFIKVGDDRIRRRAITGTYLTKVRDGDYEWREVFRVSTHHHNFNFEINSPEHVAIEKFLNEDTVDLLAPVEEEPESPVELIGLGSGEEPY